jgi:hypothetical protein
VDRERLEAARSLLVEAAWALLRWKTERTKALHEWTAQSLLTGIL